MDAALEADMLMEAATKAAEEEALLKSNAAGAQAAKESAKESLQHSIQMEKFGDKKVKYNIFSDDFALAPVQWSAERPKPVSSTSSSTAN